MIWTDLNLFFFIWTDLIRSEISKNKWTEHRLRSRSKSLLFFSFPFNFLKRETKRVRKKRLKKLNSFNFQKFKRKIKNDFWWFYAFCFGNSTHNICLICSFSRYPLPILRLCLVHLKFSDLNLSDLIWFTRSYFL